MYKNEKNIFQQKILLVSLHKLRQSILHKQKQRVQCRTLCKLQNVLLCFVIKEQFDSFFGGSHITVHPLLQKKGHSLYIAFSPFLYLWVVDGLELCPATWENRRGRKFTSHSLMFYLRNESSVSR